VVHRAHDPFGTREARRLHWLNRVEVDSRADELGIRGVELHEVSFVYIQSHVNQLGRVNEMDAVFHDWPYAGVGLAAVLLGWLALEPRPADAPPRWRDPSFVLALLWPMYLVHQFEEHGIDLHGRHFAFLADICATIARPELPSCPADASFIFAVNAVACPTAFVLPLIFRRRAPLVAMFGWSVPLVNAVAHIGAAITNHAYNPGLATAVVLFAPMSAWMIYTMRRARLATRQQVMWLLPCGGLLHAVLFGSLIAREHGWISHTALLVINALDGLVPWLFGALLWRGARAEQP
jgi:Protein of unknown function with HXXEE motif